MIELCPGCIYLQHLDFLHRYDERICSNVALQYTESKALLNEQRSKLNRRCAFEFVSLRNNPFYVFLICGTDFTTVLLTKRINSSFLLKIKTPVKLLKPSC